MKVMYSLQGYLSNIIHCTDTTPTKHKCKDSKTSKKCTQQITDRRGEDIIGRQRMNNKTVMYAGIRNEDRHNNVRELSRKAKGK